MAAKLQLRQGQVWHRGDEYFRIVKTHRLEVEYKAVKNLTTGEGTRHHVSKKEFCRLLKTARLLSPAEIASSPVY